MENLREVDAPFKGRAGCAIPPRRMIIAPGGALAKWRDGKDKQKGPPFGDPS